MCLVTTRPAPPAAPDGDSTLHPHGSGTPRCGSFVAGLFPLAQHPLGAFRLSPPVGFPCLKAGECSVLRLDHSLHVRPSVRGTRVVPTSQLCYMTLQSRRVQGACFTSSDTHPGMGLPGQTVLLFLIWGEPPHGCPVWLHHLLSSHQQCAHSTSGTCQQDPKEATVSIPQAAGANGNGRTRRGPSPRRPAPVPGGGPAP